MWYVDLVNTTCTYQGLTRPDSPDARDSNWLDRRVTTCERTAYVAESRTAATVASSDMLSIARELAAPVVSPGHDMFPDGLRTGAAGVGMGE